jgi:hypothetical protein
MIFGATAAFFITSGRVNDALKIESRQRLVERFMRKDFGHASFVEQTSNRRAFREGGEVIGKYQQGGATWVAWAEVAGESGPPNLEPGMLMHYTEWKEGWHKAKPPEGWSPSASDRIERDDDDDEPDITIVAAKNDLWKERAEPVRQPHMQPTKMGYSPDKKRVAFLTSRKEYSWPTELVPGIIEGLRQAATDGVKFPASAHGMVLLINPGEVATIRDGQPLDVGNGLIALSAEAASANLVHAGVAAAASFDLKSSWMMPKHEARRMADAFEETLREMGEGR